MISVSCVYMLFGSQRTLTISCNVDDQAGRDLAVSWFDVEHMLQYHQVLWYAY